MQTKERKQARGKYQEASSERSWRWSTFTTCGALMNEWVASAQEKKEEEKYKWRGARKEGEREREREREKNESA